MTQCRGRVDKGKGDTQAVVSLVAICAVWWVVSFPCLSVVMCGSHVVVAHHRQVVIILCPHWVVVLCCCLMLLSSCISAWWVGTKVGWWVLTMVSEKENNDEG
jgi:hypothetical protein